MSSINYISLGNTNMNIIRCKLQFFFVLFFFCLTVTSSGLCETVFLLPIHICSAMEMHPASALMRVISPGRGRCKNAEIECGVKLMETVGF